MGKLNLPKKSTRTDIAYATHQRYHFFQYTRASHGDAIIHLVKYLKAARTQGITLDPKFSKSFMVYADADFCGNWHRPTAGNDPSTAKYQTGYAILNAGCPIFWCSNLQTQIALSMMEVDYIYFPQLLSDTIPVMQLLREMKGNGFPTTSTSPEVHCQSFEYNSGTLELSHTPKIRTCAKHINLVIITSKTP